MDWNVNNAFKTLKDMEPKSVMDVTLIQSIDPVDIGLGPTEKGPSVLPPKRKKTMTSVYLKFFETAPDGKSRRCKFCGQTYSIATATGNLGRHLSNRHPGYDSSGDAVASTAMPMTTVIKKAQPPRKAQVDYDHLNWLLIKWLALASLPPSSLEEKWLLNSFKFLNPSIQFWPSDRYRTVFREVFRSMQDEVKASLEQVSSKVSIVLDFWTSYEQMYYLSVACQWIDESWSFQKLLLDICHIPFPCEGSEIYHSLVKVLKMYNLEARVLSCTHNNTQNAIHACHTLKEELDGQKLGPFCYIPCAARSLNTIIDDGLRTTKQVISKVRDVVLKLNSSSEIEEEFVQLTAAYHEGHWKFPLESSARWSGNYQMLDIVRKAGKSLEGIMRKCGETLSGRIVLTSAEKNAASIVHGYLEPFFKTTNDMCTTKLLTVGLVLFFMEHISEMITLCKESQNSPEWLKSVADDMGSKARSYTSQVCNTFTYMTAILDPRIKCELIPESFSSGNYLEEAKTYFIRNYSSITHYSSMSSGYSIQEPEDGGSVSFAEEIARKKRRASLSNASDELTQYLLEPPAPIPTDVLEWWKANSTRYPRLSVMARDFLAVQPTSVAPEEVFCSKGDEIDRQRFCMPHDSAQTILCVKSWIQGGIKLKYKSTEIDYEKLMELAVASAAGQSNSGPDKKQK